MTDREMLEYAAKAAGIAHVTPTMVKYGHWNPRDDDGDSFRLMVELQLELEFGSDFVSVGKSHGNDGQWHLAIERGTDPAAARRAIFRAAAEIGRAMP